MNWYIQSIKKYAHFKGRASRREFWVASLVHMVVIVALVLISSVLATMELSLASDTLYALSILYVLFCIVPSWSVAVRRLHDTGRSGWWMILNFIPLVNVVVLIFWFLDGDASGNKYGPNPKLLTR